MKLFVSNSYGQKVYLNLTAYSRQQLANQIGGSAFFLGNEYYDVNQVWAEVDSNSTTTGAAVGGLIGILGGPVGILVGGVLGGLLGNSADDQEAQQVRLFNNS